MKVGVIMGSASDYEVMSGAIKTLEEFGIECEKRVISAHRAPDALAEWSKTAKERGLKVIIAGAGGAAHLPGVIAAMTTLPVIGIPVATMAIDGAKNAALYAVAMLALSNEELAAKLDAFRQKQTEAVLKVEI